MAEKHICHDDEIFVFGSNTKGRHGKGAALTAVKLYGAIEGQALGLQGRSYAIPTREYSLGRLYTLPLIHIRGHVERFLEEARGCYKHRKFFLTAIGTGLAGYTHEEICRLFDRSKIPQTVRLPPEWRPLLRA